MLTHRAAPGSRMESRMTIHKIIFAAAFGLVTGSSAFALTAPQVGPGCVIPSTTFNHVWYIDPVNGKTPAAMTAAGIRMPTAAVGPSRTTQGSASHPWNSLEAVFQTVVANLPVPGYANPLLTTAPYYHAVTFPGGGWGYDIVTGPNGVIQPGDEVLLMSGNYGAVYIGVYDHEITNQAFLTIAAAPGQTPILSSLRVSSTNEFHFSGITVQDVAGGGNTAYVVSVSDQGLAYPTSDIVFDHMTINSGATAVADTWTRAQWLATAHSGFAANGGTTSGGGNPPSTKCISLTNSHISTVRFGVAMTSDNSILANNEIDHFSDDAVDIAGNNLTIQNNYIHDCLQNGDGNHPDAVQFTVGPAPIAPATFNAYVNVLVDSNTIVRQADPNLQYSDGLQGITAFDADWTNVTISNNIVATRSCYGTYISSFHDSLVINNTFYDDLSGTNGGTDLGGCIAGITITAVSHESADGTSNTRLANNISGDFFDSSNNTTVTWDHNLIIGGNGMEPLLAWCANPNGNIASCPTGNTNGAKWTYTGNLGNYDSGGKSDPAGTNIIVGGGYAEWFVNPTTIAPDLHLLPGSPALADGTTLGAPLANIDGDVRISIPANGLVTFSWSYSGNNGGPVSASGSLTALLVQGSNGQYVVSAITGQRNGVTVTGLAGGYQYVYTRGYDLYGVEAEVDSNGLDYTAGGAGFNIYYYSSPQPNSGTLWCGRYGYCEVGPSPSYSTGEASSIALSGGPGGAIPVGAY
jgi:hypothetical protein